MVVAAAIAEGKIFTYEKVTPSGKLSPALRDMIDEKRELSGSDGSGKW